MNIWTWISSSYYPSSFFTLLSYIISMYISIKTATEGALAFASGAMYPKISMSHSSYVAHCCSQCFIPAIPSIIHFAVSRKEEVFEFDDFMMKVLKLALQEWYKLKAKDPALSGSDVIGCKNASCKSARFAALTSNACLSSFRTFFWYFFNFVCYF